MNTTFLVTISPAPNRYNKFLKNPLHHLYAEDMLYIKQSLGKHISKCYFIPELDPKGRLHYHGIMDCDAHGVVSFYKSVKPRFERLGFVQAPTAKDFWDRLRWIFYMRKCWWLTQQILEVESFFLGKSLQGVHTKKKRSKSKVSSLDESVSLDYWKPFISLQGEGPPGDTPGLSEEHVKERSATKHADRAKPHAIV